MKKRTHRVSVSLTENQYTQIEEYAEGIGVTTNSFLVFSALEKIKKEAFEK